MMQAVESGHEIWNVECEVPAQARVARELSVGTD